MKSWLLSIIFLLGAVTITSAQFAEDYEPLQSEGEIPRDVYVSSSRKFESLDKNNSKKKYGMFNRKERRKQRAKSEYYLQSSFGIDQLVRSDRVIFNDEVSRYIKELVENLLPEDHKLKDKIQVYTVRSAEVNAFATDRGAVFVNMGLLARMESENQLAFVLAHELIHVEERHGMDTHLEYNRIEHSKKSYRRSESYDELLEKHGYSQKVEEEADVNGIELFLETEYSLSGLDEVFDLLAISHTPYTNTAFNTALLHTFDISIPNDFMLDTVSTIQSYLDNDELSTHPALKDRKAFMQEQIKKHADRPDNIYLLGKDRFEHIRERARFELCDVLVRNINYLPAVYHTAALMEKYPDNDFLRRTLCKALYGLAHIANEADLSKVYTEASDIQGEMQQCYHLFQSLSAKEVNVLALGYVWQYVRENPKDDIMKKRAEGLLMNLLAYHSTQRPKDFFQAEYPDLTVKPSDLGDLLEYGEFNRLFRKGKSARKKYLDKRLDRYRYAAKMDVYKEERRNKKKGYALGIKRAVIVNPRYMKFDYNKKRARKRKHNPLIKAEEAQDELSDELEDIAKEYDMKVTVLDVQQSNRRTAVEEHNEALIMEAWFKESLVVGEGFIPSMQEQAAPIMDKYNSEDIIFMAMEHSKGDAGLDLALVAYSYAYAVTPIFLYTITEVCLPNHETQFLWGVVDFETKTLKAARVHSVKLKDKDAVQDIYLHSMFKQLSKKKRK